MATSWSGKGLAAAEVAVSRSSPRMLTSTAASTWTERHPIQVVGKVQVSCGIAAGNVQGMLTCP